MRGVLAIALLAAQAHSQSTLFRPAPGSPVTVGAGSGGVLLADLNGDGHLDMMTRHLLTRTITVQRGDGHGRFAAAPGSPIVLGYRPGDMELGDVNTDGILDLVVTRTDRDIVDVFLGNGSGGFSLSRESPFTATASVYTPTKPSLHLVDINEDGNLDVVLANGRRNILPTLLGDGRGRFSPGPITRLGSEQDLYSFAFGDVDGDGHVDVMIARSAGGDASGRVMSRRGDGRGAFTDALGSPLSVPPDPRLVALADVNGDQRLDIVLSHDGGLLRVLLNGGNGRFSPAPGSPYNLGTQAFAVVVADVNGDRRNDLVAATVNSVTVLLGDMQRFAPAPGSPFRAGPGAYDVAVGDVDGDGKLDVAASSFEGQTVTVLLRR